MARLYDKYDEYQQPIKCYMPNSKWFRQSGSFTPKGVLWHDTGADNPWLKRYVQPADNDPNRDELLKLIGKNTYGNDWEHGGKDKDAGLNCWVGKLQDGKVTTLQAGDWTKRPWGCGSRKSGYSLNDTHIQWEICQDAKKDKAYFADVYEESVAISAYLCKMFKIDPHATFTYKGIKVPTVVCHWDSYNLGCGSGHGDIYDWDVMYDYLGIPKSKVNTNDPYDNLIMRRIRDDIAKAMQDEPLPVHPNGWAMIDGKWYYYSNNKLLKSQWLRFKGSWYYLGSDGAMLTGWQTIDGVKYYLYDSGVMAQDEWIEGCFADMDGAMTDRKGEWHDEERGRWFGDKSGWYPKSRCIRIDDTECKFDSKGYLID